MKSIQHWLRLANLEHEAAPLAWTEDALSALEQRMLALRKLAESLPETEVDEEVPLQAWPAEARPLVQAPDALPREEAGYLTVPPSPHHD
ncbi:MAG: hypothetical protein AAGD10_13000 [Myxococcota bacterium]